MWLPSDLFRMYPVFANKRCDRLQKTLTFLGIDQKEIKVLGTIEAMYNKIRKILMPFSFSKLLTWVSTLKSSSW